MEARQALYYYGARAIEYFQQAQPDTGPGLLTISSLGDPSKGFILYFPIILGLNYVKGVRFLGAFIVNEWSNMVS